MSIEIDWKQCESDMDVVAEVAAGLHERMVEDSRQLFVELVGLWSQQPEKAAQVTMCLVAWFDPEMSCSELWRRVDNLGWLRTAS